MGSKEKVRRKFLLIRQRRYFNTGDNFFKPLIKIIDAKKKRNISLYYPSNHEVNTLNLFNLLENRKNISISLPKILKNGTMNFIKWKLFQPLMVNSYGFVEPLVKGKKMNPDLIVVPLLAYDKFHNRLGYGKGYYDKTISKLRKTKKIFVIGLAYDNQKLDHIPVEDHDEKMDLVLTEKNIYN